MFQFLGEDMDGAVGWFLVGAYFWKILNDTCKTSEANRISPKSPMSSRKSCNFATNQPNSLIYNGKTRDIFQFYFRTSGTKTEKSVINQGLILFRTFSNLEQLLHIKFQSYSFMVKS